MRAPRILLTLLLSLALVACGGDDPAPADDSGGGDALTDAAGGDASGDGDGGGDATCTPAAVAPVAPDPSRKRFAMSLFHYNVEYVIGGLDYTDASGTQHLFAGVPQAEGWTNDKVEDWIITETLRPILAMYDKHPSWGVTLEMQGYLIEVLAERHPETLTLLRKLAQRGQAELVSFHYAAQLFLAYPREDLARSIARTRAIFATHCLPLSKVVFNQEGQAGEGRQRFLVEQGYEIGVHPKNLFKYVRSGEQWWPWYASGGTLIVGPGGVDATSGVEVAWDFFDDGELRAAGGNPYFAPVVQHDPERVAEFEAKLSQRAADGWHMATISDYVRHLEAKEVEKKPAPPLLDGTWQPPSTESIHRWLGGRSDAFPGDEEDGRVRSGNAAVSHRVRTCQVLLEQAETAGKATEPLRQRVEDTWTQLWHAEVSDCSGVNPWRGEVLYGIEANARLMEETDSLRRDLAKVLGFGPFVEVDSAGRTAKGLSDLPSPEPPAPVDPPFAVTLVGDTRALDVTWQQGPPVGGNPSAELMVRFSAAGEGPACAGDSCDNKRLVVAWPRFDDTLRYSPGLIEDEVRSYPLSAFAFGEGEVWLPLANGLIGLGSPDGGDPWWVVKHTASTHIAARVRPDVAVIDFVDEAIQPSGKAMWVFHVFRAKAADALAHANRWNIGPLVRFQVQ